MESASDFALAAFIGTLLAVLVLWVLSGRTDELRRGVRMLLGDTTKENYVAPVLDDYEEDEEDEN